MMGRHRFEEWPLVFFTLLSQMAAGIFVLWGLPAALLPAPNAFSEPPFSSVLLPTVLILLVIGGLSAAGHLGRLFGAVYSLRNWRSSWLSREALLSGSFGLSVGSVLVLRLFAEEFGWWDRLLILLGCIMAASLVVGISRLYRLRTVPAWDHPGTLVEFTLTALLTGTTGLITVWYLLIAFDDAYAIESLLGALMWVSNGLILLFGIGQAVQFGLKIRLVGKRGLAGAASASALKRELRLMVILRWSVLLVAWGLLFFGRPPLMALLGYGLVLVSELIGRYLFYASYRRSGI
jgi:anaerobic dimethyl sulfoxide reductase subunit C (anchor subunit)